MALVRNDILNALDYMDKHNLIRLSAPANGSARWQQLHCPFHNNGQERRPSCGCSLEEQVMNGKVYKIGNFHCFSCGAVYSFRNGVKEILVLKGTTLEAHPDLKPYLDNDGIDIQGDSLIPDEVMQSVYNSQAVDNLKLRLQTKRKFVSEDELKQYRFTVPYMYQRKLTDAVIEKYDIGFDGKFLPPGRKKPVPCITFPVHDSQGRTLFICRRSIEGKFFYLPSDQEKSVFGLYELPEDCKEVIICESVLNALTAVVYGHPAVALFGTGTQYEYEQLRRLGASSYVLCLDNDEAGNRGTEKLKKALSKTAMVWTMHMPDDGRDLNDLDRETFIKLYNERD